MAGENFGCGSSREHAAWALSAGHQSLIAPSFARIFHENCYLNGLVPIVLTDPAALDACFSAKETLEIDVINETVRKDGHEIARFELDPLRKDFILHGGFLEYLATKVDRVRDWKLAQPGR